MRSPLGYLELLDGGDGYRDLREEAQPALVLDAREGRVLRALDVYRQYLRVRVVRYLRDARGDLHRVADGRRLELGEDDAAPAVFEQVEEIFKGKRRVRVENVRVGYRKEEAREAFFCEPALDREGDLLGQEGGEDQRVDERDVVRRDKHAFAGVLPVFPALYLNAEKEAQNKLNDESAQ